MSVLREIQTRLECKYQLPLRKTACRSAEGFPERLCTSTAPTTACLRGQLLTGRFARRSRCWWLTGPLVFLCARLFAFSMFE